MYTRTQICAHFGISSPTFQRYRAAGVVAPPTIAGNDRLYTNEDVKRIRQARQALLDDRLLSYRDFAERHPHPQLARDADQDRSRRSSGV